MKAAIYARYSSENQSEKSIDDQIRVCKNYGGLVQARMYMGIILSR